jgi:hypothetical protein
MSASISVIVGGLKSWLSSDAVWLILSISALLATVLVSIGLYLEYDWHEIRPLGLAKTRPLKFSQDFPVNKQYAPSKKRLGSFLVVAGVILEAALGLLAFTSATIRETESQARILALQKEMSPRHIDIFLHAIGPLREFPKMAVVIRTVQDTESRRLLFDLVQLLQKCGWRVMPQQEEPLSMTPDGIDIVYRAADAKVEAPKAARALSAYLNLPEVGIMNEVSAYPNQSLLEWWPSNGPNDVTLLRLEPNSVTVFIGLRPVGDRPRNWFQPEKP